MRAAAERAIDGRTVRLALAVSLAALALGCTAAREAGLTTELEQAASGGVATWRGTWFVPSTGLWDVGFGPHATGRWSIDGYLAAEQRADQDGISRSVWLTRGFHAVELRALTAEDRDAPGAAAAPTGRPLRPLETYRLFQSSPDRIGMQRLRAIVYAGLDALERLAPLSGIAALIVIIRAIARRLPRPRESASTRLARRIVIGVALIAILALAGALRIHAIVQTYGLVEHPGWARSLETRAPSLLPSAIRARLVWEPAEERPHRDGPPTKYSSDPYTYLEFARAMTSFSAAHYREPIFPYATKLWLRALDDQDVAVSFASALFSLLAVAATFLLGLEIRSAWAGLGAALAMAIEYDLITWGIGGWRDDAFMTAIVLGAAALIRVHRAPTPWNAVLLGVTGAFACLVRMSAITYLLPGLAIVAWSGAGDRRRRLQSIAIAIATIAVLVGPYMINCWRVYGDPLYALDYHTGNYQAAEGREAPPTSVRSYVQEKMRERPFGTIDTVAIGLTSYPFLNKWTGFDRWGRGLGSSLSWLALAGLVMWLGSRAGRLLLVVLLTSLLPFAVTWRLTPDFRYTEHAYPFFLIAACSAAAALLRVVFARPALPRPTQRRPARLADSPALTVAIAMAIGVVAAGVWRFLPAMVMSEALAAGENVSVAAGGRDAAYFGSWWSPAYGGGPVVMRVALRGSTDLWLPLPRAQEYAVVLRMDPFPRPLPDAAPILPRVHVSLNDQHVADLQVAWNPQRVGAYEVKLSAGLVRPGWNRMRLEIEPKVGPIGLADGGTVALWYARIRPPEPEAVRIPLSRTP